ncbi:MAG TPA: hypothetical protein VFB20_14340 [Burkholderiales bacterium]|nr:hypothetical protein [Burkholderiales bacterium]
MRALLLSSTIALLAAGPCAAAEFPEPPPDAPAAQAAGLQRLTAAQLESAFAGRREERNSRGELYIAQYRADGSVELRAAGGVIDRGAFRVMDQHGGSVCLMLEKQMNQRLCSIWFAAPDGMHLFGYNPTDGRLRVISRAVNAER